MKSIITGDLSKHRVRQVIVTPPGLDPGPDWTHYASLRPDAQCPDQGEGSGPDVRQSLTVLRPDGTLTQLVDADIWRAGAHAKVPDGAIVVGKDDTYTVTRETIVQPRKSQGYTPAPEGPMTEAAARRDRGNIDAIFPALWASPRTLSVRDEEGARLVARPRSEYLACSVRPENNRWTYATGTGSHLRVWGAAVTQEEAVFLATARLHAAWITWHDQVLQIAGGRTDWLGGLPAPEACEILLLGRGEAGKLVSDARAYDQVAETMQGGTQAALKAIIDAQNYSRAQLAEILGVSLDTVHSWLRPPDNVGFRAMPLRELERLHLKLKGSARE